MNHWSVDEDALKKDPKAYAIWKLEQMANFGLDGGKINKAEYQAHAREVVIQDIWRKRYLDLLAYGE